MIIPKLAFGIVLILLCILAGIMAWKATHNDKSVFNFSEAFIDADGKTSMGRIGAFTALASSTWALVYLVMNDRLTEWFYAGYMAAWVVQGGVFKWLDRK